MSKYNFACQFSLRSKNIYFPNKIVLPYIKKNVITRKAKKCILLAAVLFVQLISFLCSQSDMTVLSTLLITISESIFGQLGSTAVLNPTAGFVCFLF